MPRARKIDYYHLTFKVQRFQRYYSFGLEYEKYKQQRFSEHFTLQLTATLLSEHPHNGQEFSISIAGREDINSPRKELEQGVVDSIGYMEFRKDRYSGYVTVPECRIGDIWAAMAADGLSYIAVIIHNHGRNRWLVKSVEFQDHMNWDDL